MEIILTIYKYKNMKKKQGIQCLTTKNTQVEVIFGKMYLIEYNNSVQTSKEKNRLSNEKYHLKIIIYYYFIIILGIFINNHLVLLLSLD